MVLIAVAVMLALWALYALTRDEDPAATNTASETGVNSTDTGAAPGGNQTQPAPAGGEDGQESQPAEAGDQEGQRESGQPAPERGQEQAPDAAPAPAGAGGGEAAAAPKRVSVLNNSMVPGLAADISERVEAEGYELGEVGNFNEEILPETTVFFPKGDQAAEAEARRLADKIGGVARENIDALPREATADRGLTIVLTNSN